MRDAMENSSSQDETTDRSRALEAAEACAELLRSRYGDRRVVRVFCEVGPGTPVGGTPAVSLASSANLTSSSTALGFGWSSLGLSAAMLQRHYDN